MKNNLKATELLDIYYKGFAKKEGWESVLAEDFKFVGGSMLDTSPVVGKQAYIEIIKRFSRLFKSMQVKTQIVEGDKACVIGTYDYAFPNGKSIKGDVAEIWKIKDGKLDSLTIFFDTLTFDNYTRQNTPEMAVKAS
jgi:ketosteroid isomerase-like protein